MAGYKVFIKGVGNNTMEEKQAFLERLAAAYNKSSDQMRELINLKKRVLYTFEDPQAAGKAKQFLESLGATVEILSENTILEPQPVPPPTNPASPTVSRAGSAGPPAKSPRPPANPASPAVSRGQSYKYRAFISYSHQDNKWCDWLHRALETYQVPKKLVGQPGRNGEIPKRLFPIFRDRDELPVSADLPQNINTALRDSQCLIVICSPKSATSRWVNEEIKTFKAMGREDRVLCLIIDGEPNADLKPKLGLAECFPPAIKFRVDANKNLLAKQRIEPIAADSRPGKDGKQKAKLKLVAGILGLPFDALQQRDQERQRVRRLQITGLVAALILCFLALGSYYKFKVQKQRELAQQNLADKYLNLGIAAEEEKQWGRAKVFFAYALKQYDSLTTRISLNYALTRPERSGALLHTLEGHQKFVKALAFSPDGKFLASGSYDGMIKIWDPATGKLFHTFDDHTNDIETLAFSPDGKTLASGSRDYTIKLWDPATGQLLHTLDAHKDWIYTLAFSPDGRNLASGSRDTTIKLWDPATGQLLHTLDGHKDFIYTIAFSPDGRNLASGSRDDTIKLWDPATGKLLYTLDDHKDDVNTIAFSPDGKLLASGSDDTTIKIWDPATGKLLFTLEARSKSILSLAFRPDGKILASSHADNTIKLWVPETGKLLHRSMLPFTSSLEGHKDGIVAIFFSPDGKTLASGSIDATIKLWDPETGELLYTLEGHKGSIYALTLSPDGKTLASGGSDKSIKIWDTAIDNITNSLEGHQDFIQALAFSPDGKTLASGAGDKDKTIILWDTETGKILFTLGGHNRGIAALSFSPDGKFLASGSYDATIKLWDPVTGRLIHTLEGHAQGVTTIVFSPDGKFLASRSRGSKERKKSLGNKESSDRTIIVWDLATGQLLHTLEEEIKAFSLAFSPDGKFLASGNSDNTIKLWDPVTGSLIHTLEGHKGSVNTIVFSPNGEFLASGSHDATIKLWDPATGKLLQSLEGHQDKVLLLAFSPDGKILASGSEDRTIKLWKIKNGKLLHTLEDIVISLAFIPDGKILATSGNGTLSLWDPATGNLLHILRGYEAGHRTLAFSPNGKIIAAHREDATVKLWTIHDEVIHGDPESLLEQAERVSGLKVIGTDVYPWNPETGLVSECQVGKERCKRVGNR